MEKIRKFIFVLCLVGAGILVAGNAFAELVNYSYENEINTNSKNGVFAIYNASDPGVYITKVEITLGNNAAFGSIKGLLIGSTFSHYGTPWTTSDATGLTDYTKSADNKTLTLTFSDFGAAEAMGLQIAYQEPIPESGNNAGVGGNDMNNSLIKVYFSAQGVALDPLIYNYGTFNGNKTSFPSTGEGSYNSAPIPATLYLFGAGIVGLAGLRRRFKK